jgi:hypothetical protein
MTCFTLKLEAGAGTSITEASEEAQSIADKLGVIVSFDFNGVDCNAVPNGNAHMLAERQQHEQARSLTFPGDWKRAFSS